MNNAANLTIENLPKPIADKLAVTAARIRRVIFLRGLFAVLAIALVTLLTVMLIDAATLLFSSGIRWALSLSAFAVIAFAVFYHLIRPLSRKLTLSEIARIIETRSESLQDERISSTVEILGRQYEEGEAFSPVLLNQLVHDAEKDADVILPKKLFTLQSAKRFMVALGMVGFVYLMIFVIWPGSSARLLVRAVAPFAEVGGAMADRLSIRPGDVRIAVGDPLTIEVALTEPTQRAVELRTRWEGRPEMIENMQSAEDGGEKSVFSTGFPRVSEDFEYRIRSGHALSRYHRVRVFPRPELSRLHVTVTPPEYTGLEAFTESMVPGRVQVLAGSQVRLAIETNAPLEVAELFLDGQSAGKGEPGNHRDETGNRPVMRWNFSATPPERSFDWRVKMTSRDGFENKPVLNHLFAVEADQPPEITLVQPKNTELELPPDGFFTLSYALRDDYGISRAVLKVTVDEEREILLERAAEERGGGLWAVNIPLVLQSLNIDGARSLRMELRVEDNLPESLGGPNVTVSESVRILLEQDRDNLARQEVTKLYEESSAALEQIIKDLEQLSRESATVSRNLEAEKTPEAMAEAEKVRSGLQNVDRALREVAADLAGGVFDPVARGVQAVAEQEIRRARELGEELPLTDNPADQKSIASNMRTEIDQALEDLRRLDALNDSMAEDALRLAEIEEMNRQQDALAEEAQSENWSEMMEEWLARQEALAAELAAMTQQEQKMQEFAQKSQDAANALQEAAEQGDAAAELSEEVELPPWMLAQDAALQAQLRALEAQDRVLVAQEAAAGESIAKMKPHQQLAEASQKEADLAQLDAERAQKEALRLLREGGTPAGIQAQENANTLQEEAKQLQLKADVNQKQASEAREAAEKAENPVEAEIQSRQQESREDQHQALLAQQRAVLAQQQAFEAGAPDLDQALQDAVAQQQAAEAAQQAALEAQRQAEEALESIQDVAGAQEAASQAQAAAAAAQEQAAEAQQAASEAQQAAQNADNPEAAEAAQAAAEGAQEAANQAQQAAETAQQQAVQAQQQAAQMQEEAGQQEAAAAQTAAAEAQQAAQQAQQEASQMQEQANQAQQAAAENGTPEAAQAAEQSQNEAAASQQAASEAQQQASQAQEQAEQVANAAVETAQQNAAEAQQEAVDAQQAAVEAQQAALAADPQSQPQADAAAAQQEAQSAQTAANQAQQEAQQAAQQAEQSGLAEDLAAAEAAQQAATAAQEQAAAAQEAASAAQPQTPATEAQTAAMDSAQQAQEAAATAMEAAAAAAEAGMSDTASELEALAGEAQAAAQSMEAAAAQPGLPTSTEAMNQSAEQMAQIAQQMQGMTPPAEGATPGSEAMAQAAAQAAAAAEAAGQRAPAQSEAAAQAAAAAQSLQQAGQSMAQAMGMEAPPSPSSPSSPSSPGEDPTMGGGEQMGIESEAVPAWVSDIGMTRADWVRMRGLGDPDGVNVDDAGIPREYRKLVRDYFLELNRDQPQDR